MVICVAEDGGVWHEPPYAEERDLDYRINCPPIQVMHGRRTIVPQPPRPAKSDPLNDPPESQTPTPAK